MGKLHCGLENRTDLYVNKRQKIRNYRAKSKEEEEERRRMPNREFFYFARCVRKLALYSDVIYTLLRLKISHRTRW